MIIRKLKELLIREFFTGKVIVVVGPRQVGKTTLIEEIIREKNIEQDIVRLSGDYIEDRDILNSQSLHKIQSIVGNRKYLFIDEGQKAVEIGVMLKILVDHYGKDLQVIVTGSFSLHILDKTSEPLTGRKRVFYMYPVSIEELVLSHDRLYCEKNLEELLIYGSYPAVLNQKGAQDKIRELVELTSSNLYRDILEFQQVHNASVISRLLKLLALQAGSEVSLHKLGLTIGMDQRTVERYIDLLEKSFVLFRVPPYFTNKKKELSRMNKILFYDNGIRNALLNNFLPLDQRNDVGLLFENFILSERLKYRQYHAFNAFQYFWRDKNQAEIDLIEEYNGSLHAYEIKWNKSKVRIPGVFQQQYSGTELQVINKNNYLDFLLD